MLPYYCLVNYCLIKRHSKNLVTYLNMFYNLASEIVNWHLHFANSP